MNFVLLQTWSLLLTLSFYTSSLYEMLSTPHLRGLSCSFSDLGRDHLSIWTACIRSCHVLISGRGVSVVVVVDFAVVVVVGRCWIDQDFVTHRSSVITS